ncbi:hypothetical protein G6L37_04505 [Agrobacterium rubi]|nr:hypothetical protein [Agrobacterium rubi]NTF24614.1 hypothetical protein [Agrobacterium rubi]
MPSEEIAEIREVLVAAARKTRSTGPDYTEMNDRIRRWMVDLARSVLPIYLDVGRRVRTEKRLVVSALESTRQACSGEFVRGSDDANEALKFFPAAIADMLHNEELSGYHPTLSASRAALQAIQTAVSSAADYDIHSLTAKATMLAEQCALSQAYVLAEARDIGVASALASTRSDFGEIYLSALINRLDDDMSYGPSTSVPAKG